MNIQLFKRLLQFLKPYKSKVVLALLCSTIVGAIATSPVPLIQKTFDDIFTNRDFFLLKVVPLVFVLLYFIKGGLSYIQNLLIYGVSWELVVSLRKKMFKHLHSLPLGFFEEGTTGQLISRIINDVSIMQSSVTSLVKETLQSGIMFIGLLCWIFYLKWDWALIALIILPVAVIPIANISRKLRRLSHKGQEILADITSTIVESFSGIKVVRAFGLAKREQDKFTEQNEHFLKVMKKNVKYIEIPSPFMEFLGVVSGAFILWYGGHQVLTNQVSQGTFIAFNVALFMMYQPIRLLFKVYAKFQGALAGAERVFFILDQNEETYKGGTLNLESFNHGIEYKNITFRYPSRNIDVLKGINMSVNKSEVLAIVGMSGSGKTTLVDLLFRFFDPTQGQILLDGRDIREFNVFSLRSKMALVTQETFLFNDTIRNNIAFGKAGVTEEKIIKAAQAAHVDNFVRGLDDGYDTLIGERGVKLSGGQRQRIAIARAILRNAPILILDEATSSLDSESERLVQDALHNLMENRTTFVIAHRLSTIKHAHRIIVLDQGKMVEEGTHDDLIMNSGIYQKLYEKQIVQVPNKD